MLQVPSLSSLGNPLPQVVKPLAVIEEEKPQQNDDKIVIILHTRDISIEEEFLMKKFGNGVRNFNPSMVNVEINDLKKDCSYLFVDIRNKYYRNAVSKLDTDKYRFAALVQSWEKMDTRIFDEFYEGMHIMSKLPSIKVSFKEEWDDLLCDQSKIKTPGNSCLSFLSYIVNVWDSLKKS